MPALRPAAILGAPRRTEEAPISRWWTRRADAAAPARRIARAGSVAALVALGSGALAGCSPATGGAIAVGRGDAGEPVVVLMACSDAFSRLAVGIDRPTREEVEPMAELQRSTPLREADGPESVSLLAPQAPWRATPSVAPTALEGSTEYVVGASDEDLTVSTHSLTFRPQTLADLPDGEVLAVVDGRTRQLGLREFTRTGCRR